MTSGGPRQGAGRKRRKVPKVSITVRLEPEVHGWLEFMRRSGNYSQSAKVSELIEDHRKDFERWKRENGK